MFVRHNKSSKRVGKIGLTLSLFEHGGDNMGTFCLWFFFRYFFLLFCNFLCDSKRFLIYDTNYCILYVTLIVFLRVCSTNQDYIFHISLPYTFPILSSSWGKNKIRKS